MFGVTSCSTVTKSRDEKKKVNPGEMVDNSIGRGEALNNKITRYSGRTYTTPDASLILNPPLVVMTLPRPRRQLTSLGWIMRKITMSANINNPSKT